MIAAQSRQQQLGSEPVYLTRIRLRAQRRTLWLRRLWSGGETEPTQGLAISHEEVDRILAGPEESRRAEVAFYAADQAARALGPDIEAADTAVAADPAWASLRRGFGLSDQEMDLLQLAVALESDPLLRRAYAYLHDDATAAYPTPWLAACLFQWPATALAAPWPESPLVRWRLAQPREGSANPWSMTAPWAADPCIVAWVATGQVVDPVLGEAVSPFPMESLAGGLCLYPEQLDAMRAFVGALWGDRAADTAPGATRVPIEIALIGPGGSGKRTLVAQLCAELGAGLLVAEAGLLLGADQARGAAAGHAVHAARAAALSGAVLYWHGADDVDPRTWAQIAVRGGLTFFGAGLNLAQQHIAACREIRLAQLNRSQREALWSRLTDMPAPLPVREWALTPAEMVDAARVASAGEAAVVEACHQAVHREPGELFTLLPCPYTWDDIVLTQDIRQHLAEIEALARRRTAVYEGWGFERLVPLGRGVTALFAGPSGTGKTMAAQVLARALDVELYRVDLAGVVNKYIGETEKRLKLVFDACERANVLLFFDEADALFGQRTQVKDAHDRFANIEIDYLLQRMEQFDGLAILATNRKSDMDSAFVRRLRFIVDFLLPGPAERLALWHLALAECDPQGQPLLDGIDWDFMATSLNMTGAQIKAAALGAAFLARADSTRIGMRHVLHAARREFSKVGLVLRDVPAADGVHAVDTERVGDARDARDAGDRRAR